MSGTAVTERIPYKQALEIAYVIQGDLVDDCERLEFAGSKRPRSETVGDIEIVAVPKYHEIPVGLFGETKAINLLDAAVTRLLALPGSGYDVRLDKNGRRAVGEKYKRLSFNGVALDLFSVVKPAQWGVIFAIRTGPASFSHRFVSHPSVKLPDDSIGTMPFHMCVRDGQLWSHGQVVETPTEQDFFAAIGQPYLEPWERR